MNKIMLGIGVVVLAMIAVLALAMPAAAQAPEVYLVPQDSSAKYCNTVDVEIWVNAENFQSGQINLTYDSTCANVTNFARNTATFPLGTWTHSDGQEWITFLAITPLTGEYLIGTLTIHCVNDDPEGCTTPVDFVTTGAQPCALFNPSGNKIPGVTWTDGTFECSVEADTEPPYTAGHDPAPGDTNVPVDTNIVVRVLDDDSGVNRFTIVMTVEGAPVFPTITGTPADYKLEYDPPVDFDYEQVVDVTIDASDNAGNVMPTDSYSFTTESAPPENKVFFVPQESEARHCEETDVQIWVNATNFQGGQINLTYYPTCANVTDWEKTVTFPLGVWDSSIAGREWITFTAATPLTGEYLIGTLMIHCVCEEECTTPLDFVTTGAQRCALFDPQGGEIPTDWIDGTFKCTAHGLCGDVNCDEEINMGDVILLLNHVTYPDNPDYEICDEWAGDVNCDEEINMGDVILLLNHVSYPDNPDYELHCC